MAIWPVLVELVLVLDLSVGQTDRLTNWTFRCPLALKGDVRLVIKRIQMTFEIITCKKKPNSLRLPPLSVFYPTEEERRVREQKEKGDELSHLSCSLG